MKPNYLDLYAQARLDLRRANRQTTVNGVLAWVFAMTTTLSLLWMVRGWDDPEWSACWRSFGRLEQEYAMPDGENGVSVRFVSRDDRWAGWSVTPGEARRMARMLDESAALKDAVEIDVVDGGNTQGD